MRDLGAIPIFLLYLLINAHWRHGTSQENDGEYNSHMYGGRIPSLLRIITNIETNTNAYLLTYLYGIFPGAYLIFI